MNTDRYKEVELINDTECDPLIRIMPTNDTTGFAHLTYTPTVLGGDMIINGRLITASIRNMGQFINYLVHLDDGLYYTKTETGVVDTIPQAKTIIKYTIIEWLKEPL